MTDILEEHGGDVKSSVTGSVTHVITNEGTVLSRTSKIEKAIDNELFLISEDFIHDSVDASKLQDEKDYALYDYENEPKKKKKKKKKKRKREDEANEFEPEKKRNKSKTSSVRRTAKGHPVPHLLSGYQNDGEVYSEDGDTFSCMLNQTNISNNNNKFYEMQLIILPSKEEWMCFTHWGRVGKRGSVQKKKYRNFDACMKEFKKKFRTKTGNKWEDRGDFVEKAKKYTMIDVSYEDDDEDEKDEDGDVDMKKDLKCELDNRLISLMSKISSKSNMDFVLKEFMIDTHKMPLGKLSKKQLDIGFEILKEIEEKVQEKGSKNEFLKLCNEFYTKIPHVFGMKRPPLINTLVKVKERQEMLESLRDMAIASKILRESGKQKMEHPMTAAYRRLNCKISPLSKDDETYSLITQYVSKTHGPTHSDYELEVMEVYQLEREGEKSKFSSHVDNKVMLWHGSRITNFMGILSEGLRIAPPSAPVTGYMFGKGIYFADMVSKSANYCRASSQSNVGCLLLCEVALGKMLRKKVADYSISKEKVVNGGGNSVMGVGGEYVPDSSTHVEKDGIKWPIGDAVEPDVDDTSLLYNEYIVYDEDQVNLKYLVMVKFDFQ